MAVPTTQTWCKATEPFLISNKILLTCRRRRRRLRQHVVPAELVELVVLDAQPVVLVVLDVQLDVERAGLEVLLDVLPRQVDVELVGLAVQLDVELVGLAVEPDAVPDAMQARLPLAIPVLGHRPDPSRWTLLTF